MYQILNGLNMKHNDDRKLVMEHGDIAAAWTMFLGTILMSARARVCVGGPGAMV
jgi:hypothetical protein